MLDFIFKWWLFFYKRYLLFSLKAENEFFLEFFSKDLDQDLDALVAKFDEFKKEPEKHNQELTELQQQILKLRQIQQRLSQNEQVQRELESFIESLKKI